MYSETYITKITTKISEFWNLEISLSTQQTKQFIYMQSLNSLNFTVLVPLSFILYDVQLRYRPASRDLKRIGSVSLSPIYAHFSDTLSGLATIRSMKATRRFVSENEEKVEANTKVMCRNHFLTASLLNRSYVCFVKRLLFKR